MQDEGPCRKTQWFFLSHMAGEQVVTELEPVTQTSAQTLISPNQLSILCSLSPGGKGWGFSALLWGQAAQVGIQSLVLRSRVTMGSCCPRLGRSALPILREEMVGCQLCSSIRSIGPREKTHEKSQSTPPSEPCPPQAVGAATAVCLIFWALQTRFGRF